MSVESFTHHSEFTYWIDNDMCFCGAMRIVMAAGLMPSVKEGIKVDRTQPPPGLRLYLVVPPPQSYTGSPASECDAIGKEYMGR